MEKLYIENHIVDLGSSQVKLSYKSNLFSDLSKITSNRSYTINLPITPNNDKVFSMAGIPTVESGKVRKYLTARYEIDGIEIISNGRAVLMKVTETSYELALAWGIIDGYKTMVDAGVNISGLPAGKATRKLVSLPLVDDYKSSDYLFCDYKSGYAGGDEHPRIFPSVKVNYVLDKISEEYGIRFDFPTTVLSQLDSFIIPLTTRRNYAEPEISLAAYYRMGAWTYQTLKGGNGVIYESGFLDNDFLTLQDCTFKGQLHATCGSSFQVIVEYGEYEDMTQLRINSKLNPDSESAADKYIVNETITLELDAGNRFKWYSSNTSVYFRYCNLNCETETEVLMGYDYPVIRNLPDVSCVDFIKEICVRVGVFPINTDDISVLKFISADELVSNGWIKAKDWSDKLVAGSTEVSFEYLDFAQRNMFLHATDSFQEHSASGAICVNNETLSISKDMFSSKFSASKSGVIELYTVSLGSDGELEVSLNKLKPRIGVEINSGGRSTFSFTGMDFESLIQKNLDTYQDLMREPVLLKRSFRLDPWDLKDFDFSIPVYVKSLGRRYAVVSMTNGSTEGVFDVELLQLYNNGNARNSIENIKY